MSAYTISQPLLCAALRLVPINACVCESMCVWQLAAVGSARLWPSLLTCSGSRGSRKSRVSVWATRQLVTQLLYCDCGVYSWSLMANEQVVDAWDKSLYWQFLKKALNFERKVKSSNLKWSKKVDFMYTQVCHFSHFLWQTGTRTYEKALSNVWVCHDTDQYSNNSIVAVSFPVSLDTFSGIVSRDAWEKHLGSQISL